MASTEKGIFPIGGTENPNRALDVIFVHGLGGDAYSTWTEGEDLFWPKWLSEDVPEIGVWTIGYGADRSRWVNDVMSMEDRGLNLLNHLSVKNLGEKPLVFVSHSMGGLISKHILDQGRDHLNLDYRRIVDNTLGLIFLAVPHSGSGWADALDAISLFYKGNPIIENLRKDDKGLRRLSNAFSQLVQQKSINCLSFFETKELRYSGSWFTRRKGIKIVSESSARGDFPQDTPIGLDDDHLSICRLKSRDAQLYGNVQKFIQARLRERGSTKAAISDSSADESTEPPPADKIQITKLPHTNSHLFGRETEIAMLDRAWAEGCNVLILKAMGGTGKTALLKYWLDQFVASGYRGAEAVFTWSFYSQGSAENKQTSTDDFFESALRFFGYAEQNLPPPHERGIKLAQLIAKQRTLLILDGLEPLQHPIGIFHGELKDQSLKALLQQLAVKNAGLCLISSRQTVEELKGKPEKLVLAHDIEQLQEKDGVALLRAIGVKGSEVELTKAVEEVAGHALALNLLGNYVKKVLSCDIRQRDKIPGLMAERNDGKHAEKMLAAYETHLKGTPALSVLYLLGLFDRPVSPGAIQCLKEAKIPGLTDQLGSDADWCYAIDDLLEQRLLNAPNPDYPDNLDCHPLIREYFGGQLQTQQPQAWQQAHERLYEYYKALPEKEFPDTLEEMQPLFSAVAHGCAAGLHQQALEEVYWPRIKREGEHYLTKKLGAFSDDLATVAHFFTTPWHTPAADLSESAKAVLLNWAGFRLRALGRLREALEPMQANIEMNVKRESWKDAAPNASNLSELQLTLGDVAQAVESGARSSRYADQSGDMFQRLSDRTTHADALHQAGDTAAALALFREAEQLQQEDQPAYPRLYSLQGFRYCDLLLAQGSTAEVLERAEYSIEIAKQNRWLLDIALDQLTLGRAHLQQLLLPSTSGRGAGGEGLHWLDQAVAGLRAAGQQQYLPHGLLARAALHRHTRDFTRARQDLQEVFDIADGSGMRLHLTDYHLEMARLLVAESLAPCPPCGGRVGEGLGKGGIAAKRLTLRTTLSPLPNSSKKLAITAVIKSWRN